MKGPDLMEEEQSRGSATSFEDQEILRGAGGMSWPRKKLELLAADEPYSFVGGPFGSKLTSRDYSDQGIPVIRGSNLNNGRFLDMNEFVYVSDSKVRKDLSGNLAKPGDLVFTQRGTLGQVAIIPKEGISDRYVVSQSQMKLTVDDTKADQFFLYYYFSSREVIDRITNFTSSSGVPHINLTVLRNFEIPVPPLEIQKSIASILSAYDDLIENNRRRIQLLEQAARLLYKEWFVHLRFPGHEHVRVMDGVPEGWKRVQVKDVLEKLNRPKKIKQSEYLHQGPIPCVDQSRDFIGGYTYDEDAVIDIGRSVIVFGDHTRILKYVDFPFACGADGTQLIVSNDPGVSQEFLYFALDAIDLTNYFYARHFKFLKDQFIPRPKDVIISQFSDVVRPTLNQIKLLSAHCERLAKARDLLLPRLMKGVLVI